MSKKPRPEGLGDAGAPQAEQPTPFEAIAIGSLSGDLRDFLLDRLKHDKSPLPWDVRSEGDQRDVIDTATRAAEVWVRRAVLMINGQGQKAAQGRLVKMAIKDEIQMVISIPPTEKLRHELMDHTGSNVLIIIADAEEYYGERSPVSIRKDQGDLVEDIERELKDNEGGEDQPDADPE